MDAFATTGVHCTPVNTGHASPVNDGLTDYSPRDKPWDTHKGQAQAVGSIYADSADFERYATRISKCSGVLRFGWADDPETGESSLKLREAHFCRVRNCPCCQWRRSLMWLARFYQSLPDITAAYPRHRWLFLTTTVRNCPVVELRQTLKEMNAAWNRLRVRKEFKPVSGWLRTTEITRGKDGSAHPHFHTLLLVPPSMVSGVNYIKQARWTQLWQESMRLDYSPMVDIRAIKSKAPKEGQTDAQAAAAALQNAAAETLKYAVKPSDMVADPDWFLEMSRQVHKLRFVASGGALKDVLREDDESAEDLLLAGEEGGSDDGARLAFNWREGEGRYRRFPRADKAAS